MDAGCSSLTPHPPTHLPLKLSSDGFIYEHGPFRLTNDTGSLVLTPFEQTWVVVANMLYLEAPVGM